MVRKWSYLNPSLPGVSQPFGMAMPPRHIFKVFRKSTRFKKYTTGLTSTVRRLYSARKHRTNWIEMSYITKDWMFFFYKNRQFIRFFQSLGAVKFSSYSVTSLVFTRQVDVIKNMHGISMASCSRNLLRFFKNQAFAASPLPKVENALLFFNSPEGFPTSLEVGSGLIILDKLLYPHTIFSIDNLFTYKADYANLIKPLTTWFFKYVLFCYKILVHLTCFNTSARA